MKRRPPAELDAALDRYVELVRRYHDTLDLMSDDVDTGRAIMLLALEELGKVNQAYPNSMIIQMFTNAKMQEIVEIYKRGTQQEKDRIIQLMSKVDPTNASQYRSIR